MDEPIRKTWMVRLEDRLLFDAVPFVPPVVDGGMDAGIEPAFAAAAAADALDHASVSVQSQSASTTAATTRNEIIIVDMNVKGSEELVDRLREDYGDKVFVLSRDSDGVKELTNILRTQSDLDAVHLISRASEGTLYLGNATIDWWRFRDIYTIDVRNTRTAFKPGADLLIYGSDFNANNAGVRIAEGLSSEMKVNVAASNDRSGNASLGGNWTHEYQRGTIEATALDLSFYNGLLSMPKIVNDVIAAQPGTAIIVDLLANDFDPSHPTSIGLENARELRLHSIVDPAAPNQPHILVEGNTYILRSGTEIKYLGGGQVQILSKTTVTQEERLTYWVEYDDNLYSGELGIQTDTDGDGIPDLYDPTTNQNLSAQPIKPGTPGEFDNIEGEPGLYMTYSILDRTTFIRTSYIGIMDPVTGQVHNLGDGFAFQINSFAYDDVTDAFYAVVNSPGVVKGVDIHRGDILKIDRTGEMFVHARPTAEMSHFHPSRAGGGGRSAVFLDGTMYMSPNNLNGPAEIYSVDVATGKTTALTVVSNLGWGGHLGDMVEINGEIYGLGRNYDASTRDGYREHEFPYYLVRVEIQGTQAILHETEVRGLSSRRLEGQVSDSPSPNYLFDAQWSVKNGDGSYSLLVFSNADRNLYRIDNLDSPFPVAYLVADTTFFADTIDGASGPFTAIVPRYPDGGDPGNGDPGNGDPGNGDPGDGDPGDETGGEGEPKDKPPEYGKDSFTDEHENGKKSPFDIAKGYLRSAPYSGNDVLYFERLKAIDTDPVLTGIAVPGAVLVGRIYDSNGTVIAEARTTVDRAGNWNLQFFGVPAGMNTRVVIEHIATEEIASGEVTRFQLTENLYRSLQLEASPLRTFDYGSVMRGSPSEQLRRSHLQNMNPLNLQ